MEYFKSQTTATLAPSISKASALKVDSIKFFSQLSEQTDHL